MIIITLFIFSLIPQAYAACAAYVPLTSEIEDFNEARTIFVGKVLDVYDPHPDIHPGTEEYDTITFDVTQVLKGKIDDGKVITPHDSTGYNKFKIGQSYLVFAFGTLHNVSQCSPPILYSMAAPVLLLFTIMQYYFVIGPAIIGGIVLGIVIWRKRK